MAAWILLGWTWDIEGDPAVRFPAYTRAIPRRRPPPGAPGLHRVDQGTLARHYGDQFRFTYAAYVCVRVEGPRVLEGSPQELRILCATEREELMGYHIQYP